jgi:polyphosphate glucokinase
VLPTRVSVGEPEETSLAPDRLAAPHEESDAPGPTSSGSEPEAEALDGPERALERILSEPFQLGGAQVLGIDIGGSGIKGALVEVASGALVGERLRLPTPRPATPEAVASAVAEVTRHFNWSGPIGCAFPAVVKHGVVRTAANVDHAWVGRNGQTLFEQATGCRVLLLNDADAAGIGEMAYGTGVGQDGVVLMVTLGTGIGSALFVDRRLVPNTELGHLELRGKDAERRAAASVRERKGWGWRRWARHLDDYLHALERLFWPDLFIIGGGVSSKAEKFFPHLTVATPVVAATLRNEAGIVGAARAASALLPAQSGDSSLAEVDQRRA